MSSAVSLQLNIIVHIQMSSAVGVGQYNTSMTAEFNIKRENITHLQSIDKPITV
jgi:hypothetical protein